MSDTHRQPTEPTTPPDGQLSSIARSELALVRAALGGRTGDDGGILGTAGIALLWAVPAFAVAGAVGLAKVMPGWLAVLCVVAALLLLGIALTLAGRARLRRHSPPPWQQPSRHADPATLDNSETAWPQDRTRH